MPGPESAAPEGPLAAAAPASTSAPTSTAATRRLLRIAVLSTRCRRYTGKLATVPPVLWPRGQAVELEVSAMKLRSVFGEALGTYFKQWWELVPRAFVIYLVLSLVSLA